MYIIAASAAPGVMGNPPKQNTISWKYKVKRPWSYTSSPYGDGYGAWTATCIGVVIKTDLPNDVFLDGPDLPHVWKSHYIKEIDLEVREIISYEPLIYIKSESWYDHKIEIESLKSTKTKLELGLSLGNVADSWGASVSGGGSIATVKTKIVKWSITASGGQYRVVYVKMIFLHIKGTIKYHNNQICKYDVLIVEEIQFDNIEVIDNGYEFPHFETKLFDGPDTNSNPDKYYNLGDVYTWTHSKETSTSSYVGIDVKLGGSKGFFLKGSGKITYSKTNKFIVRHVFINKGIPSDLCYFYFAYNNFYSLNIIPVIDSTGDSGGGGGGGQGHLVQ
jgi:hypothetical protein